jgi:ABC-type dipeptide/oligopeptide/nickel transport system permease subunit
VSQAPLEPPRSEDLSAFGGEDHVKARSPWEIFWARFRSDKLAVAGVGVLVFLGLLAIFAPVSVRLTGHDPNDLHIYEVLDQYGLPEGPQSEFWFGADSAGRDVFVRVIYGTRTSLTVALLATTIELGIGIVLGLLAGFYRGRIDTIIMRTADVIFSIPVLMLALGLVAACGLQKEGCLGGAIKPGILLISYVIGLFGWPYIARIVRGQVLSLREKEFVEAARAQGASNTYIIFREILPNILAPVLVYGTLVIPENILYEAALSFLGLGVPANTPSWGYMLNEASSIFTVAWWLMLFPGVFLFLTTFAFNLAGDGLRDALDPRTASR